MRAQSFNCNLARVQILQPCEKLIDSAGEKAFTTEFFGLLSQHRPLRRPQALRKLHPGGIMA
jgi:hypothetical protein